MGDLFFPPVTWRGLPPVPCEMAPYDFSLSQPERRYPYIDGAGHDFTGRDPLRFNLRFFFQNHFPGEGILYPIVWEQWRDAFFDGASGDLDHPDVGLVLARVLQGHVEITSKNRSGIVVDVIMTETLDDPELLVFFGSPNVDPGTAAKEADAAVSAVLERYPDGTNETDLFGAWESIKGQVFSAGLSITGAVNQMQGKVSGLISDVESLNDPELNPASSVLLRLWGSLEDFKKNAEKLVARKTSTRTTTHETTLDALARETGNTTNELMGLNLALLKKPSVPRGTRFTFYSGSSLKSPIGG